MYVGYVGPFAKRCYPFALSHFAWQTLTLLKCFLLENGGGERVFSM